MPARVVLLFFSAALLFAQPAFDVASVKPGGPVRPDGLLDIDLGTASHGTVTLSNTTLSECLQYAYGLTTEQQITGPDWIRDRSIRFQIVAKAPSETPIEQLRLMLQRLLNERFRIEMHREKKKIPHFELTVGKNGPRMPASESGGVSVRRDYGRGRLSYSNLSMNALAMLLSRQLKQPVFNNTALEGGYDIDLSWAPEDAPPETDAAAKPDIFGAIQQLGLKLEASRQPLEVLVIDRADKTPVAN